MMPRPVSPRARRSAPLRSAAWSAIESLERRTHFASQLTPVADADAHFRSDDANYANANFGADPQLRVSGVATDANEAFLVFDLTGVTGVGTATLKLTGGLAVGTDPASFVGVFVANSSAWVEGNGFNAGPLNLDDNPAGEIDWNNRPGSTGGDLDTVAVSAPGTYSFNVTSHLQALRAAGATRATFVVRSTNAATRVIFGSRESGGSAPVLDIADDVTAPTAAASATTITTSGGTTHTVSVTYADAAGVNAGTLDTSDITVSGPGGPVAVTGVSVNAANPKSVVATYTLAAPGGTWDGADNGTYTVTVGAGQALDFGGNAAAGGGSFTVAIPVDTTAPVIGSFNGQTITTSGGTNYQFAITYTDAGGLNANSIDVGDLTVARTSPAGPALNVTAVSKTGSGGSVTATYTVAAPGGAWDGTDNGTYTVTLLPNQVLDAAGNAVSGSQTFIVAIPVDTTPPVASTVNAQNVTAAGAASYTFSILWTDNETLNAGSIDPTDVTITRNGDALPMVVTSVSKSGTGGSISATYTVSAPGGSFDTADNGVYTISVGAGRVTDVAGNANAPVAGSFTVAVPDTGSPGITITPVTTITTAGITATEITVVYTDNQGVNASTIDSADVSVIRDGGGPLAVTLVSTAPAGNATSIQAVYSVAAPGGFWNNADNGSYTVTILGGAVRDTSNNPTPLAAASFLVDIQSITPVVDPGFNGGDPISTGFVTEAMTIDPLGRILIAGRQGLRSDGTSQSILQRLNADGTLDTFFGEGGQIIANPGTNDGFMAVAVDSKLRTITAGYRSGELELMRFDSKGRPDRKFGQGGVVLADWGAADDTAYAVTVLANGRILVAGTSGGQFALARFDDRGNVETSFAAGGAQLFKPGTDNCTVGALSVRPDGTIVAAGTQGASVVLLRFDANGTPDATFGAAGVFTVPTLGVRTDLPAQDHTVGLALTPDGDYLVGNHTTTGDFGVLRLNPDGSADTSFGGGDGISSVDFGGADDIDFIGLQGTGQIILAGTTDAGAGTRLAVAALNADGSPDGSFSSGGKFTVENAVQADPSAGALTLHVAGVMQPDGRLLATTSEAFVKPTSSPLRRLVTPGSGVIGSFGILNGRAAKLTFLDADETKVTLTLKGAGVGQVLSDGSVYDLTFTGMTGASVLTIATRGGDGRVMIRDLRTDGPIKTLTAKKADFVGTISVAGALGKASIGNLSGTFAAAGNITSLVAAGNLAGAFVLAGVATGGDGKIGGSGANADTYAAARLGKLTVTGSLAATKIRVGVTPVNGSFDDADDAAVGGPASALAALTVRGGVDAGSGFAAGLFGKVRIPGVVDPAADARFKILPGV